LYNDSSNAVLLVESAASPTKDARARFRQLSSEGTIGFVQSGGGFVVGSVSPTPFLLYANSTERMRITPTGNIGIGTISPTEKLEVSGKVKAQELCLGADCRANWEPALATTGALDLYVSPGGSDSNPGTMSLPFMTIQKALETVPQKVLHPVTINIMSGTYSPVSAPSGFRDSWILISKDIHYQSGGFLSLVGSGAQIMNANGWAIGITIARSSQGVRLEGLSVSNFNRSQIVVDGGIALMGQSPGGTLTLNSSPLSERALEVTNGGQANLDNFSASGFRNSGISIDEGSSVRIESGTSTLNMPSTPNYVSAVDIGRGGQFEIEGGSFNITALSSPSGGAAAFGVRGGSLRLRGGGLALNGVGLTTTVIRAEQGASVSVEATPSWTGVAQTFMTCSQNSSCVLGSNDVGTMTLMMMGANLLFDLSDQSSLRLTQPVQIGSGMSSVQTWFSLNNQSTLLFERAFTNSSSLTGAAFVRARNGSTVQLRDVFTASSGQPGTWFDLANHSRIHALMNVSLTSASQTNENPMSFTENSSGLFEQNLTVATSSASGASLFLQGNSSVVVRQTASLTTNALGTSALRLEQNSTAEFQGAFSATGSGSDLRLVSANSGSSLRFKPLSASTNIWVSCSGGSSNVGFDVNNRSSIVFEGPSGRFTTNNIQGGCTTAAQIKNHSRFELSAGMISLTPLNGTISVSRLSTFSKGGTSQVLIAPACSLDSLCD
nr:hypothetical protein [Pseudobdellovibrionaceae bacterium]